MIFPPFTELATGRLVLRKLQLSDAAQIFKIRSNASVNEFIDRVPARSVAECLTFVQNILKIQKNEGSIVWVITIKGDPALIGTVIYWHVVKEKEEAELGYELLPEYFGKGIMYEAVSKVIQFGFETMKLKTIVADIKHNNLQSIRLIEKCGFEKTREGECGYGIYELKNQ